MWLVGKRKTEEGRELVVISLESCKGLIIKDRGEIEIEIVESGKIDGIDKDTMKITNSLDLVVGKGFLGLRGMYPEY